MQTNTNSGLDEIVARLQKEKAEEESRVYSDGHAAGTGFATTAHYSWLRDFVEEVHRLKDAGYEQLQWPEGYEPESGEDALDPAVLAKGFCDAVEEFWEKVNSRLG